MGLEEKFTAVIAPVIVKFKLIYVSVGFRFVIIRLFPCNY